MVILNVFFKDDVILYILDVMFILLFGVCVIVVFVDGVV